MLDALKNIFLRSSKERNRTLPSLLDSEIHWLFVLGEWSDFSWLIDFTIGSSDHLNIFPSPIFQERHTRIPSSVYSMLLNWLIPANSILSLYNEATALECASRPFVDAAPSYNSAALVTSFFELIYARIWHLITAAIRSHGPFPPWGSQKSIDLIQIRVSLCKIAVDKRVSDPW